MKRPFSFPMPLMELLPSDFNKIFYTCTGSESIELAIKLAREYFDLIGKKDKKDFITFDYSYHGTYYASMSASGLDQHITESFGPKVEGFHYAKTPYSDRKIDDLVELLEDKKDRLAGIIVEPIIGSGGIIPLEEGYVQFLKTFCQENDILLIFDEVATGFGRTGKMFAFEHFGVEPDILCMAKGINSGYLPLGAVAIKEKLVHRYVQQHRHVEHQSTQNGNPLACAAGMATIQLLTQPGFLDEVAEKGQYFLNELQEKLQDLPFIGEIRGKGLMVGIEIHSKNSEFIPYEKIRRILSMLEKRGLLAFSFYSEPVTAGISLFPALIITKQEMDRMVSILVHVLRKVRI